VYWNAAKAIVSVLVEYHAINAARVIPYVLWTLTPITAEEIHTCKKSTH
jgi:hypothetical protein